MVTVVGTRTGITDGISRMLGGSRRRGAAGRGRSASARAAAHASAAPEAARQVYVVGALNDDGTTEAAEARRLVRSLRAQAPDAAIIVLLDDRDPEAVRAVRAAGASDFVGAAVAANPAALEWRISEALRDVRPAAGDTPGFTVTPGAAPSAAEVAEARARAAEAAALPSSAPTTVTVDAPALRDPGTGRLDARRIARRLGVSVSRLAGVAGVTQQALSARPAAASAQAGLLPVARVLAALDELLAPAHVRMWLQAPHARLGGRTPLDAILAGEGERVARLVEGALEGLPD